MANRFTTFPESWWAYMPKPFKLLSDDLKALEAIVAAGGSGTPAGTTFAGIANGAAWPAPWTPGQMPGGASMTVQSEQGQLATGSTVGNYESTDGASARYTSQVADFTATFTFRRVGSVHVRFVARCNAQTLDPQDGIIVGLNGTSLALTQVANYNYTSIATTPKTWSKNVDYKVKVAMTGATVQAKSWLATDAEPGAWDVSGTTTRTAAGHLGFWAGCDAAACRDATGADSPATDTGGNAECLLMLRARRGRAHGGAPRRSSPPTSSRSNCGSGWTRSCAPRTTPTASATISRCSNLRSRWRYG